MTKNFQEAHQLKNTFWTRNETEAEVESYADIKKDDESITSNHTNETNSTESSNLTSANETVFSPD